MRISADPKHPAFSPIAYSSDVYLDGALLKLCVVADDVAGTVECYRTDEGGNIAYQGEACELVTRSGRVSIAYPGMDFDAWMRRRTDAAHQTMMDACRAPALFGSFKRRRAADQ